MFDKFLLMVTAWHDWPDNFSTGLSVNGIGDLFSYVNFVSGRGLGGLLLITIAAIGFFSMKSTGHPASKVMTSVLFATTILSVMLMIMGLITFPIPMILSIITIIAGIVTRDEAGKGL